MGNRDFNKQFDAIKRQATDLVHEMHARKLAIPAMALLAALVAAVVLLPKSSTPPPAPPTAAAPVEKSKIARVAQVSLIEPSTLDEDIPLTSSADPFTGETGYKCQKVSSNPKAYRCLVSNIMILVLCNKEGGTGPCAANEGNAAGSTSGTGGSGDAKSGTGGGTGGDTGGGKDNGNNNNGGGGGDPVDVYYVVTVSIDDSTTKNVEAGTELPKSPGALVVYAGPNDAHTKGIFILADGVTAEGVAVDETFGSFALSKGQTVTLTDVNGVEHKMTLKSISKATK